MTHRVTMALMGCVGGSGKVDGCMRVVRGPGGSKAVCESPVNAEKSVAIGDRRLIGV